MEHSRPLESRLSPEALATLVERVEAHYVDQATLLNEAFELSLSVVDYTEQLTAILHDAPAHDAWQAVYRAFHFAVEINQMAGIQPLRLRAAADFPRHQSAEERRESLLLKSSEYMQRTPALDVVTARFMPELDPTGDYAHLVDTVVGLTSLQLERGYHETIAANEFENWDDTIEDIGRP